MAVYGLVMISQLLVPLSIIAKKEGILRHGEVFRFKTAPVDPYDPFRGRYVALSFERNSAPYVGSGSLLANEVVFARIENDAQGFARLTEIRRERPPDGAYLKTIVRRGVHRNDGFAVVAIPFDRFYMNEKKAPEAERLYREHNRGGSTGDAYVTVRIHDGEAVLEQLFVGGVPIAEAVE